ncbi:MAG TPA: hypothetical protein VMA75_00885 [Candidatus Paceibacterota bacterium]|nr:hypothetical protein [Candidatus Paceibacterota bacterium]
MPVPLIDVKNDRILLALLWILLAAVAIVALATHQPMGLLQDVLLGCALVGIVITYLILYHREA